jgi:hypothetical protein
MRSGRPERGPPPEVRAPHTDFDRAGKPEVVVVDNDTHSVLIWRTQVTVVQRRQ